MAQWLMNPTRNHEVEGSIPDLAQWVNNLALLCALVQVADAAQILSCCGSGVGQWLQLQLDPQPGNLPYAAGAAQEMAKKKKMAQFALLALYAQCLQAIMTAVWKLNRKPSYPTAT